MEERILHLTLKKKWFDMILSDEKKEEYRSIKPYWIVRFANHLPWMLQNEFEPDFHDETGNDFVFKKFDFVLFKNGYQKNAPTIKVEFKGISIGPAKPEWSDNWQGEVFVIKLGEIITNQ